MIVMVSDLLHLGYVWSGLKFPIGPTLYCDANSLASVVKACEESLLMTWFISAGKDPIALFRLLDVETETETCERAMSTILASGDFRPYTVKDFESLSCEGVLFWRCLVKHYKVHAGPCLLELFLGAVR